MQTRLLTGFQRFIVKSWFEKVESAVSQVRKAVPGPGGFLGPLANPEAQVQRAAVDAPTRTAFPSFQRLCADPLYNVSAVVMQGETGADFLEKNICKAGRDVRSPR